MGAARRADEGCLFLILAAVLYLGPKAIFYLRSIAKAQTILLHRLFPGSPSVQPAAREAENGTEGG